LINDLRRAAADIFEIQFYRSFDENAFELNNDPYWVTHHIRETLIPDPSGLFDRLLPWKLRRARLRELMIRRARTSLCSAIPATLIGHFFRASTTPRQVRNSKRGSMMRSARRKQSLKQRLNAGALGLFEVNPEIACLDALRTALVGSRDEIMAAARTEGGGVRGATEGRLCNAPEPRAQTG
jgi:hypothetical protein